MENKIIPMNNVGFSDGVTTGGELVSQFLQTADGITSTISNAATNIATATEHIVTTLANTEISLAEIDRDMHAVDVQFNAYIADLEFKLSKYKISAPIIKEGLLNLDNLMNRILDEVIKIDTDDEKKLDLKLKLLETLNNYSNKMGSMLGMLA